MPVIAVPLRPIIKDACSYSGMCHYETRIGGEVAGDGERQGGREGAGKCKCDQADFFGASFLPAMIHSSMCHVAVWG